MTESYDEIIKTINTNNKYYIFLDEVLAFNHSSFASVKDILCLGIELEHLFEKMFELFY